MKPKKVIKECEKHLRKDPENLVVRLKLAAAYREVGRTGEAVELYRSVAVAYHGQARLAQAIAVCKSVLEIDPSQPETQALLAELNRMRGGAVVGATPESDFAEPPPSLPSLVRPPAPTPPPPPPEDLGTPPPMESARPAPLPPDPIARSPQMPARAKLRPPASSSPGRGANHEWGKHSGMTPHRDSHAGPPAGLRLDAASQLRPRTTQPMDQPPRHRASVPLLTPTPLPYPLALHDAEADSVDIAAPLTLDGSDDALSAPHTAKPDPIPPPLAGGRTTMQGISRSIKLPGRMVAPVDDEDLPTRIAPDVLSGDGPDGDDVMTTIADPASVLGGNGRRALFPGDVIEEVDVDDILDEPVAERAPPVDSAPLPDDDELTRVADDSGRLADGRYVAGEPAPPRASARPPTPGIFSRDTRRILVDSDTRNRLISVAGPIDDDGDDDDAPTQDPARPLGLGRMDIEIVDDDGSPLPTPMPRHFAPPSQDARPTAEIPVPPAAGDRPASYELDSEPFSEVTSERFSDPGGDGFLSAPHRLSPVDEPDDDEPTRPGEAMPTMPRASPRARVESPDEDTDVGDDEFELVRAFDRPFSETLQALDPDGSAIDAPLSIFSDLPDEALAEMSRRMKLRSFKSGDIVVREGDPGDACFVIARGQVRVLKRDPLKPRGDLLEVARLGDGALFGEFALLADRRRHATVQAVESSDIYEIPRRLLRELAATFPAVGPLLESFYRERLLATLLATAPFFKPLPQERRGSLLRRFRPRRSEAGQQIVTEGQRAGGLFLIVLGSVEITKRVSPKRSVLLATLGEGAYFGEMSLLKGGVANASVVAAGPTELAVMPPKDFYEVVADNPQLWDEVRREANRRQLELNQIVTGETNVV